MYLQSVQGVADVHVLDLLEVDEGEAAGLVAVLPRQDEGVAAGSRRALLVLGAEPAGKG